MKLSSCRRMTVLVDLDSNQIESAIGPAPLPRHQRRKLMSQLAAPHHSRYGVQPGPPAYAVETFPFDSFPSENPSIFHSRAPSTHLARYVSLNSNSFGQDPGSWSPPIHNAFLHTRNELAHSRGLSRGSERPGTSSSSKTGSPPSPRTRFPTSSHYPPLPATPVSRNDSGTALQASLCGKRSGHFDTSSRRSSSFGLDRRAAAPRRPSVPFLGHSSNLSVTTLGNDYSGASTYAPSVYAQSTIVASTIVPHVMKSADVNLSNYDGLSPLHATFDHEQDCPGVIELPLSNGADINALTNDRETPLHLALKRPEPSFAIVDILLRTAPIIISASLSKGADIDANDDQSDMPLDIASYRGREASAILLQSKGALPTPTNRVENLSRLRTLVSKM
ncbi:hypothetical protein Egran_04803 [Elaphomyces granulatus]|uniref:Uncharacterized protein n=1 Tax=Elaphomyces granulatus TaxID=519963 RepID=A0A232LTB9_9EURO|nr:hypothetical protein Egran_04803 [Elaphomyces granulatus]